MKMKEDEFFGSTEYIPGDVLKELHDLGHKIIHLTVNLMESPFRNAHHTDEIIQVAEEIGDILEECEISGDGEIPRSLAKSTSERNLGDVFRQVASVGLQQLLNDWTQRGE